MTADTGHGGNMSPAEMAEHVKTWTGFVSLVKWIGGGTAVLMIILAIFRTHG
jgi:hypothetical protein